ncbi:D-lactate dehydrogenase [Entomobacter blattae]|uniref:Quinone-dependent D-lactate dehydrogenase n=1 Tax=Entomobacter blattae TaxID=2762277 RepID=A0A7H1NT80_9PROT|nr:D-lactate dehydrogenase [Entomobacter blattae]QNT78990.1 Quinone-dependent D-lactate dehydrogenase [Entomobacter blattae]
MPHSPSASLSQHDQFIKILIQKVGKHNVLTLPSQTERYRKGFRSGLGAALAVVFPGTLVEMWQVFKACVENDMIVIMQAANTGLTEGSTPSGNAYDRPVVIINILRVNKIQVINSGEQVIALPGSTLWELEKTIKPYNRDPHSVIGSSCIGASVIGGICNNSGGALVHRGPAYTEMALFGCVSSEGKATLINHLGIELGSEPEEILNNLEHQHYDSHAIKSGDAACSSRDYATHVRDVEADTPSRFNADPTHLFEAAGSAGKLCVFAVRLDTFPKPKRTQVFYIGTNSTSVLTKIRRHILSHFSDIPIAGEYMHRNAFEMAEKYGKDTFLMIDWLGTENMPKLFTLKGRIDAYLNKKRFIPHNLIDKVMQMASQLFPSHLPPRLKDYHHRYEHHLLLKMADSAIEEASTFLQSFFEKEEGSFFTCTAREGEKAFLNRFVAAGSAVRYHALHESEVENILPLDIALRRNDQEWLETLPADIENKLTHKIYYGHFMCHVFHQDYIVKKGYDPHTIKEQMLAILDKRKAEYPAEHNVGHLYRAKPALEKFYHRLDPTNTMNPGIGKTPKWRNWACQCYEDK